MDQAQVMQALDGLPAGINERGGSPVTSMISIDFVWS
jgi:hypothetical protein